MLVKAKIAGPIGGCSVLDEGQVRLKPGSSLKTFFKAADAAFGYTKPRFFRLALKSNHGPVILVNGDKVDPNRLSKLILSEGDQVSVIILVGGG